MSRADLREEGRFVHKGGEAFCSRRGAEDPVQRFAWPGELRHLQPGFPAFPSVRTEEEVGWGLGASAAALRCRVVVVEPGVVDVEVTVSRPGRDEEAERPPGEGMLPSPALLGMPSDPEVGISLRGGGFVRPRVCLSGGHLDPTAKEGRRRGDRGWRLCRAFFGEDVGLFVPLDAFVARDPVDPYLPFLLRGVHSTLPVNRWSGRATSVKFFTCARAVPIVPKNALMSC